MKNILIVWAALFLFSNSGFLPLALAQESNQNGIYGPPEEEIEEKPVSTDNGAGTVTVSGFLNTRYLRAPSTSLFVFREGFNAKRGLFISHGSPTELYEALINIGAVPAVILRSEKDSETPPTQTDVDDYEPVEPEGDPYDGSRLKVSVTWDEAPREYSIDEIVSPFPGQDYDIRFKGNMENSESVGSGDLLCLDDTEIGITGNLAIPRVGKNLSPVSFIVNKRLLPPNGHDLKLIFQVISDSVPGE